MKVFERDGLTAKNANLLPLLFQDLTAVELQRISSIESPSLRLAAAWHLVLQSCLLRSSESLINPKRSLPKLRLEGQELETFFKVCEINCGVAAPKEWREYLLTSEYLGKNTFGVPPPGTSEAKELQLIPKSLSGERTYLTVLDSEQGLLAFSRERDRSEFGVAALYENRKLRWSTSWRLNWSSETRYESIEFYPVIADGLVMVFYAFPDRFGICAFQLSSGKELWTFCSSWESAF
ncbi:MAG: hypothetical protein R3C53_22060 [Pirellulaceae bacterium]